MRIVSLLAALLFVGACKTPGQMVYEDKCLACHGTDGDGEGATLEGSGKLTVRIPEMTQDEVKQVLIDGIQGDTLRMVPVSLTEEEESDLLEYLFDTFDGS